MCIFSGPVESVSKTNIFARKINPDKQLLVYQMDFKASQDIAMILPVPTPVKAAENSIDFINMEEWPSFFDDLQTLFEPKSKGLSRSFDRELLKVHDVGNFIASFVPCLEDMSRLDPKFTLPINTWDKVPVYKDWGFVVVQLKKHTTKTHPISFTFPTRKDFVDILYFPTTHIHDGEVHKREDFDHSIFFQNNGSDLRFINKNISSTAPWQFKTAIFDIDLIKLKINGILDRRDNIHRAVLKGKLENKDIFVPLGISSIPTLISQEPAPSPKQEPQIELNEEQISFAVKKMAEYANILSREKNTLPRYSDIVHSILLRRLLSGKPILKMPPPVRFSKPDYDLGEGKTIQIIEFTEDKTSNKICIDQNQGWIWANKEQKILQSPEPEKALYKFIADFTGEYLQKI